MEQKKFINLAWGAGVLNAKELPENHCGLHQASTYLPTADAKRNQSKAKAGFH